MADAARKPGGARRHLLGIRRQFLFVVPDHDLVAVFNGWNIYNRPELEPKFALDRVLAAFR